MNETLITLRGNIGTDLKQHETANGPVTRFRLGCTPSRFDRQSQTWIDGEVVWYSVSAFRTLGRHCAESLNRGGPVIVHGTLTSRTYEHEGESRLELAVTARSMGHDLQLGTSRFVRMPSSQPTLEEVAA